MNAWFWVFIAYISLNFLLFLSMVFLERKKLSSVISWTSVLTFLPILGYILYMAFGSGLSIRVRKLIANHKIYQVDYDEAINKFVVSNDEIKEKLKDDEGIIKCCYNYGSILYPANDVQIFLNGPDKVEALIADLEAAKESINMEYYIFIDDEVGKRVMDVLIRKAKEGVKVRFIYDSVGCLRAPRRFFRKLKKAGGEVAEFFPPFAHIRLINLKLNYRNHKKIVVIDGKVAYTGGINIRDDHMGKKKRVSPWRDTHLRIVGSGVYGLQTVFLNDWRYLKKENFSSQKYIEDGLFPAVVKSGDAYMQVVVSGPDSPVQKIKEVFIKLIANAKESILIQTPYFVPDESFVSALRIALASGVKVKIMIPSKPDYHSIFWVSLSYLKEFVELGADVYLYDGFLHSKVIVVDDNKLSIGTCNLDQRSFGLNFEDTVIMYSQELNAEYRKYYSEDLKNCKQADIVYFKKKRWLTKFLQAVFRLFSPIL
ncbi:MAG: cardiolipin synthase [Clostridia bacterium]|nr:cardiolipin synthase [Clostridia bacterium]